MNNKVNVPIGNYEEPYIEYKLTDFIDNLKEDLNKVPENFVDQAYIEIEANTDMYGDTSVSLGIYYKRPKTEEELSKDYAFMQTQEYKQRESDLSEYNRLKEKLGL
jgi:hypothetical protein